MYPLLPYLFITRTLSVLQLLFQVIGIAFEASSGDYSFIYLFAQIFAHLPYKALSMSRQLTTSLQSQASL